MFPSWLLGNLQSQPAWTSRSLLTTPTLAQKTPQSKLSSVLSLRSAMTINNRSTSIRCSSATLSTFPWATDFLVQDMENILSDEYYLVRLHYIYTFHYLTCRLKPFVQAVDELESSIDTSPADDNDTHRLQVVLSRVVLDLIRYRLPPQSKSPLR